MVRRQMKRGAEKKKVPNTLILEESYIENSPFNRIKKNRENENDIESFSIEQVKALLKQPNRRTYAGFRNYVLIFLLLDTGMRIGECVGLRVDAIDLMENINSLKAKASVNLLLNLTGKFS